MSVTPNPTPPAAGRAPRTPGSVGKVLAAFTATAVVGGALAAGVAMPAAGAAGMLTNTAIASFESLPDNLADPVLNQRTYVLDAEGAPFAAYWSDEGNRITVPLSQMSPYLAQGLIAIEDARYYQHNGVDVRGTVRALATNSGAGEIQQGGSTITQQYVKMVLLNNAVTEEEQADAVARTPQRKLREASYALSLEKRKTKDEILDGYLNIAYFGAGAYGAEVASERYFGVSASQLSLPQAAMLAGVVQQPGAFDPLQNPVPAQQRRDAVLAKMLEQAFITQAEYDAAVATPMAAMLKPVDQPNGCPPSTAPYFCDYVLQTILGDPSFGPTAEARKALLDAGGLFVRTTLNSATQAAATEATLDAIPATDPSGKAVAISMVEPGTGRIIAMAQNRSWGIDGAGVTTYNYNVGTDRGGTLGMQAGSTFKVFTMLAALEEGVSPYQKLASPPKKTFTKFKGCDGERFPPYEVENSTRSGTFDMYSGTALSVNTYYVGLAERTPLCRMAEIAESMGVTKGNGDKLERVPSFPLGSNEVTPLAMAGAYAAIANHGRYCAPHAIEAIDKAAGRAATDRLYTANVECPQVVSEQVADTATRILTGVVSNGTGKPVQFGRPLAGKTGTTDSNAAVWFDGYTPQAAASVWIGDPRGGFKYPLRNLVINGKFVEAGFGSTLAGPVFRSAMIAHHRGLPEERFDLVPEARPKPQPTERPGRDRESDD
jgi:membrane peptidoglycan carboxypeptidase